MLLNDRALHALAFAKQFVDAAGLARGNSPNRRSSSRKERMGSTSSRRLICTTTGAQSSKVWGSDTAPPYNCRHTYATICLMSGLNPAFIAQQLGHSVQMLLSTYARWINSSNDWQELEKLQIGPKLVRSCEEAT